ncbi:MAG TPA: DUF4112 domain-containing protein [Candidatus Binatia bacterium]|nr:DUF4112 domain-containing protein [Candidatus Binatia bacterium]
MGRNETPQILHAREVADTADIEKLADLLDTRWRIPGLGWRFGLDTVVGLVPGVGDTISGALGLYIIARSHQLGASKLLMARMGWNVLVDSLLGAIPLVGDLFDLANKSNTRNIRLLLRDLERRGIRAAPSIDVTPRRSR